MLARDGPGRLTVPGQVDLRQDLGHDGSRLAILSGEPGASATGGISFSPVADAPGSPWNGASHPRLGTQPAGGDGLLEAVVFVLFWSA